MIGTCEYSARVESELVSPEPVAERFQRLLTSVWSFCCFQGGSESDSVLTFCRNLCKSCSHIAHIIHLRKGKSKPVLALKSSFTSFWPNDE